ncbi:MAG: hypothetical protein ACE5DT_03970 [Nitrosopumilus sp.]
MVEFIITCINCGAEVTEYYNEGYEGKRGKCPNCGAEFPLE